MIVILSYCSDGSDEPEIEFVQDGPRRCKKVVEIMQRILVNQKRVQVYEIEALDRAPVEIAEGDLESSSAEMYPGAKSAAESSFRVGTEREEAAYRLGYVEAWGIAQLWALTLGTQIVSPPSEFPPGEIYRKMRDYWVNVLWPWYEEESPELNEPPPEFVVS